MPIYSLHILFDFLLLSSILLINLFFINLRKMTKHNFVETIILSFFGLMFSFAYSYVDKSFFPVVPIVILISLLYYKDELHSVIGLLPSLIFVLISKTLDTGIIIMCISLFLVLFLSRIINLLLSIKRALKFWILLFIYSFPILIYEIYLLVNYSVSYVSIVNYLAGSIITALFIFLTWVFSQFINATLNLYKSNNFIYENYHKIGLSKIKIKKFIFDNKIRYGIYVQYRFNHPDLDFEKKDKLFSYVNKFIYEKFKDFKSIFIQPNVMDFGFFFIPKDQLTNANLSHSIAGNNLLGRTENDPLKNVEIFFSKLNEWAMKNNYGSTFLVAASFYGYQTSSINDVIKYSKFMLDDSSFVTTNIVSMFDWKRYKFKNKELEKVNKINKLVNINKVRSNFLNIYNKNKNQSIGHIAIPTVIDELTITYDDLLEHAHAYEIEPFLNRYLAAYALNAFQIYKNKKKIFIQYSAKYLSSNAFSINQIKFIFWKYRLDPKILVLLLNIEDINFNSKNNIEKHTQLLMNMNVEFGIYNVSKKIPNEIKRKIKPKYIFLKESLYNLTNINYNLKHTIDELKSRNWTLVANNIKTWFALKVVISSGINFFSGVIFEMPGPIPRDLNSNFKRYINETIKSFK